MHALWSDLFVFRQVKQLAQRIFSLLGIGAGDPKSIAAPTDPHVQPGFQQTQVFIERAAQIREASVVGGLELELSEGFNCWGDDWSFQESSLPRSVCARSSVITTSTN